MRMVSAKTARRPKRSASRPAAAAPTNIPAKPMLATRPRVLALRSQSRPSATRANETSPTSIASNAQPTPLSPTIFQCFRVAGSSSSRSAIVLILPPRVLYPLDQPRQSCPPMSRRAQL